MYNSLQKSDAVGLVELFGFEQEPRFVNTDAQFVGEKISAFLEFLNTGRDGFDIENFANISVDNFFDTGMSSVEFLKDLEIFLTKNLSFSKGFFTVEKIICFCTEILKDFNFAILLDYSEFRMSLAIFVQEEFFLASSVFEVDKVCDDDYRMKELAKLSFLKFVHTSSFALLGGDLEAYQNVKVIDFFMTDDMLHLNINTHLEKALSYITAMFNTRSDFKLSRVQKISTLTVGEFSNFRKAGFSIPQIADEKVFDILVDYSMEVSRDKDVVVQKLNDFIGSDGELASRLKATHYTERLCDFGILLSRDEIVNKTCVKLDFSREFYIHVGVRWISEPVGRFAVLNELLKNFTYIETLNILEKSVQEEWRLSTDDWFEVIYHREVLNLPFSWWSQMLNVGGKF